MTGVCILGSTGSIGVSTLDVLRRNKEQFNVKVLTAHTNIDVLYLQCIEFEPEVVVVSSERLALELSSRLKSCASRTDVLFGENALSDVAQHSDVSVVVAAIVGAAGLLPCLNAAKAGKRILLANKEALVVSGELFMNTVRQNGAELLPLDSEHNAIFQCMPSGYKTGLKADGIRKIILTASGGPFLNRDLDSLYEVTPEQACAHPNWSMGKKISVDSATMLNKGLEVIEASYLFDMSVDEIDVVVHPQSIIHSMVDYLDGSVLAQLGHPDMKTPIAHALAWPDRIDSGVEPLDLVKQGELSFYAPDFKRFPCLKMAFNALEAGGVMPTILNAVNEVAVDSFLSGKIPFMKIPSLIDSVMNSMNNQAADSIEHVLHVDCLARGEANELIGKI